MTRPNPGYATAVACAAAVFALTLGVRQSMALFIGPLNTSTGLGLASISLAFGIGQLMWGVTQPIGGALSDRYGTGPVLISGLLMVGLGTALMPHAHSMWALIVCVGVLGAGGAGFAGPSILMSAVSRMIGPERRGMASATINAGGSFGQFAVLPLAQWLSGATGWAQALMWLGALAVAAIPLTRPLMLAGTASETPTAAAGTAPQPGGPGDTIRGAVARAVRDPSFGLLTAGFFVCGFHVAFIATHLPGVIAACGLPPDVGAWSLAIVGLFNIAGSFAVGWALSRWRSKSLLSLLYLTRGVAVALFLVAPKTALTFFVFSAVIGVTYLSTVPPTVGLVAKLHGARFMATLFGLVMLSHQVGGFLGAWLGGQAFERSGSYDWMWYADIALAVAAAVIHLPIREARISRAGVRAAAAS